MSSAETVFILNVKVSGSPSVTVTGSTESVGSASTRIVTVATSQSRSSAGVSPSHIWYWNESVPKKSAFGVYS